MPLYSFLGTRFPEPLPFRITLPDGSTRTDPSSFTAEEIQAAGYVGPIPEPAYDPQAEQLQWNGNALVVVTKEPETPPPQWEEFLSTVMLDEEINNLLATLLSNSPGLYAGLTLGLQEASKGAYQFFINTWQAAIKKNFISSDLIVHAQNIATTFNIPVDFINALNAQN